MIRKCNVNIQRYTYMDNMGTHVFFFLEITIPALTTT